MRIKRALEALRSEQLAAKKPEGPKRKLLAAVTSEVFQSIKSAGWKNAARVKY